MKWLRNIIVFVLIFLFSAIEAQTEQPYVILISFDGFRWDYPLRGITPTLEKFKENGVSALSMEPVFPSKTFPNHLSVITGMYPENHGIIMNHFTDSFHHREYSLSDSVAVKDARWYLGEAFWETAQRQGITCASYFWPGSELVLDYRRPAYFEAYDHNRPYETRIGGVLRWLQLPEEQRPHFITLYFHETDSKGHHYGPESPEINEAIRLLDSLLGKLMEGLRKINLLEKTNVIVVSDHGMTGVDTMRVVNIEQLLSGYQCQYTGDGPVMMVEPEAAQLQEVYDKLKAGAAHYRVYRRDEVPEYFHYSHHPFISSLVLVADLGWSLKTNASIAMMRKRKIVAGGNHGYDNHHLDMHGVFYAMGPAFKKGYRTGTVRNIDIYPLLCKIFGIMPRQNIDGQLDRISFVLRGE